MIRLIKCWIWGHEWKLIKQIDFYSDCSSLRTGILYIYECPKCQSQKRRSVGM